MTALAEEASSWPERFPSATEPGFRVAWLLRGGWFGAQGGAWYPAQLPSGPCCWSWRLLGPHHVPQVAGVQCWVSPAQVLGSRNTGTHDCIHGARSILTSILDMASVHSGRACGFGSPYWVPFVPLPISGFLVTLPPSDSCSSPGFMPLVF